MLWWLVRRVPLALAYELAFYGRCRAVRDNLPLRSSVSRESVQCPRPCAASLWLTRVRLLACSPC